MRTLVHAAIVAVACLLPASAQAESGKLVLLRVVDSLKDTEIHLAKILLERLKVNSSLQSPKGKPDDVVLRANFKAVEEKGLPKIVMLIDTRIVQRDKDGKAVGQVISVGSFADVKLKKEKEAEILVWANKLNAQPIPMRVYLAGNTLGIRRNLLNTTTFPLAENAVIDAFMRIYRAWGSVLVNMKKKGFIES